MVERLVPDVRISIDGNRLEDALIHKLIRGKVTYNLEKSDSFSLTFNDSEMKIQNQNIFDIGKTVIIELGYESGFVKMLEGEIVKIHFNYSSASPITITIVGLDKMFRLNRTKNSRSFKNIKDSDIAIEIAQDLGLDFDIDPTNQQFDYIFQNNQSDLNFLKERANRIDFEVEVEENKLIFKKARHEDKEESVELIWDRNLMEFTPTVDATKIVSEVEVRGWSATQKDFIQSIATTGDEKKSIKGEIGAEKTKSKFKNLNSKILKVDIPLQTQTEADNLAKSRLNQLNMEYITGYGLAVGEPKIRAGKLIKIMGIGDISNGEYYVISAEHIFSTRGYKSYFSVKRGVEGVKSSDLNKDRPRNSKTVADTENKAQEKDKKDRKGWTRINIDADDWNDVKGRKYEITLPDGSIRSGIIDESAKDGIEVNNITRGNVKFRILDE